MHKGPSPAAWQEQPQPARCWVHVCAEQAARTHTVPRPPPPSLSLCRVAPEVLLGGRQCTSAVDLYSFGIVLWVSKRWERFDSGTVPQPLFWGMRVRLPRASGQQTSWPPAAVRAPLQEIVTGLRPQRGCIRSPLVPEECPQVGVTLRSKPALPPIT